MAAHIRGNERVQSGEGCEWFNGYYDNAGERLEGDGPSGVRMTLTGQVFPLMMGVATDGQAAKAAAACRRYLYDGKLGGYRLNTDFHEVKLDMGRLFGYAFGHKENGAVFCHMAVMYAYALYRRGLVSEGYHVLQSLYALSDDFETARIYPGIPEYFNGKGRGMYHYLTGSASWMLLLVLGEVYGVGGRYGNLALKPKLMAEQFDAAGAASVQTMFAGRKLLVTYRNESRLAAGQYGIGNVSIDGRPAAFGREGGAAVIGRDVLLALDPDAVHSVDAVLIERSLTKEGV